MDPKYLKEMLRICNEKDLVFASRYLKEGGSDDDDIITFVGNKFFSFLGNILFNLNCLIFAYFIIGNTVIKIKFRIS